jgi:Rieske Fe-S protein
MKNNNEDSSPSVSNTSRRQFITGSVAMSGAVVLSSLSNMTGSANAQAGNKSADLVLRLNDNPELGKVGGWKVFEVGTESVIVANTEAGFVACSSKCTHKGCDVEYRATDNAFVCPCHGARYDTTGKVLRGPAKLPLKQFDAQTALTVSAKK